MNVTKFTQDYGVDFFLQHRWGILAPWIVGSIVDIIGFGILLSQIIYYFSNHPHDPWENRALVTLMALLSSFKTATAILILLRYTVVLINDPEGMWEESYLHWTSRNTTLFTAIIGFATQLYYLNRLHNLLRLKDGRFFSLCFRITILGAIIVLVLAALSLAIVSTYCIYRERFDVLGMFMTAHLATTFTTDALITGGTLYCLFQTKFFAPSSRVKSLIGRLARIAALTACVPAVFALLNLAFSTVDLSDDRWNVAFNFGLAKAYAISFMCTIEFKTRAETSSRSNGSRRLHSDHQQKSIELFEQTSMFAKTVQDRDTSGFRNRDISSSFSIDRDGF